MVSIKSDVQEEGKGNFEKATCFVAFVRVTKCFFFEVF